MACAVLYNEEKRVKFRGGLAMHSHGGEIYQQHYEMDYSVNVNAMGTPRSVIEAAARGAELSAQYPDVNCTELRKDLAAFLAVPEDWLIFGNGAADLIFSVVLYARPKKILLLAPTFAEYEQAAKVVDTQIVYYELKEENDFKVDTAILDALTEDIDMVFLCNPNNPTGQVIPREFMIEIFDLCKQYQNEGYLLFVVTNQAGIGKGLYKESDFLKVNEYMLKEFEKKNIHIEKVYYCPHKPEDDCECRKPKPGLILQAIKEYQLEPENCISIGDKITDLKAAHQAGITKLYYVPSRYPLEEVDFQYEILNIK